MSYFQDLVGNVALLTMAVFMSVPAQVFLMMWLIKARRSSNPVMRRN